MSTITAETLTLQQRYDLAVYRHFTAETAEERERTYEEAWRLSHLAIQRGAPLLIMKRHEAGREVAATLEHGPMKTWHIAYATDPEYVARFGDTRDIHAYLVDAMQHKDAAWNEYHANPDAGYAAIGTRYPDGSFSAYATASLAYVHEF